VVVKRYAATELATRVNQTLAIAASAVKESGVLLGRPGRRVERQPGARSLPLRVIDLTSATTGRLGGRWRTSGLDLSIRTDEPAAGISRAIGSG